MNIFKSILKLIITFVIILGAKSSFSQRIITYTDYTESGGCPSSPSSTTIYIVNKNNQMVSMQTKSLQWDYEGKTIFLENCKVADEKNWVCGGDTMDLRNGLILVFEKTIATNGKITVEEMHHLRSSDLRKFPIGKKSPNEKLCRYEKSVLGYKEIPY